MAHKAAKATKKFVSKKGTLKSAIVHRKKVRRIRSQKTDKAIRSEEKLKQELERDAAEQAAPVSAKDMDVDQFLDGGFLAAAESPDELSDSGTDSMPPTSANDQDESLGEDVISSRAAVRTPAAEPPSSSGTGEEAIVQPNRTPSKRLREEIKSHRQELDALRQSDPTFYKFLQDTDAELLDFDDNDGGAEPGSGAESDEVEAADGQELLDAVEDAHAELEDGGVAADAEPAGTLHLTSELVEQWSATAKQKASMGAMRQLLKAYRVACHYSDTEADTEASLQITSSRVFNQILLFVLREADGIFRRMLGLEDAQDVHAVDVMRAQRWKIVEPLTKSYFGNTIHLLGTAVAACVVDASARQLTDPAMLSYVLRRARASVPLYGGFDKLLRRMQKVGLRVFGAADTGPRVQAALLIRAMAMLLPAPALDNALKGAYRTFVSNAKFVNPSSLPHISFMGVCVVELYGLDAATAYSHAFTHIKELAVLLRSALVSKSADAFRDVYCWQTINCLELWARLLASHADKQELRPLVYPVVQLLLGAVRLVPSPRYFPLRLRLVRSLNQLAAAVGVYVPVSGILLEMLRWSDLTKAPKAGPTGRAPNPNLQLRVGKVTLRTPAFQEETILQARCHNGVMEQLAQHLGQWSCSVAFPELVHLTLVHLRRFVKSTTVEKFRSQARALCTAAERNSAWVGKARDKCDFAPKDAQQLGSFLAAERDARQAPMQVFADLLAKRAAERHALLVAADLSIVGHGRSNPIDGGPLEDDENGTANGQAVLNGNGGLAAVASRADAYAPEDRADLFAKLPHKAAKRRRTDDDADAAADDTVLGADADADDVLQDYELSDLEGSDDDAPVQPSSKDLSDARHAASSDEEADDARAPLSHGKTGRGRGGRGHGKQARGGQSSQTPVKRGGSKSSNHGGKRGRGRGRHKP